MSIKKILSAVIGMVASVGLLAMVALPTYAQYDYQTNYGYSSKSSQSQLTPEQQAALTAMLGVYVVVGSVVAIVAYVYMALVIYTIAKKVGEEPAWLAWVPIANFFFLVKIAGLNPWLGLLVFLAPVPIVNLGVIIFEFYVYWKVTERRGHPGWVSLLSLIPLVGIVVPGYIAWVDPKPASTK